MSGSTSPAVGLEDRVAQLEALVFCQRRRIRMHNAIGVVAALLVGGAAMTAAVAQKSVPAVLQTQRLEIVSADGKLVLTAEAGEHGGRLDIMDREGNVAFASHAGQAGGQVDIWNAGGANVLRAACNGHGGDLAIWNGAGQNVMGAYATARGGETAIWSSTGSPAFKATISDIAAGGEMSVFAADGTRSVSASAEADGCGRFDVYNNAANSVFTIDGQRDLGCVLGMFNNVGTRLFMVGTRPGGGLLNAMNDRGEVMGMFGVAEDGSGAMTLRNSSGMEIVHAGADANRDGIITVRDGANATMKAFRPSR